MSLTPVCYQSYMDTLIQSVAFINKLNILYSDLYSLGLYENDSNNFLGLYRQHIELEKKFKQIITILDKVKEEFTYKQSCFFGHLSPFNPQQSS